MKKISMLLIVCIFVISYAAFSQITVLSNGYVGIGTSSPSYQFDVNGVAVIRSSSSDYFMFTSGPNGANLISSGSSTGSIGYQVPLYSLNASYVYASNIVYSSDESLKKNIQPLFSALPIIKKLRPVSFDYNFDYSKVENEKFRNQLQNDDKDRLGFIAQEVQKLLPQSVKVKESDSTLGIRMDDFIPLLVKGMQEQSARIDSLTSIIEELKASQNQVKSASIETGANLYSNEDQASLDQNIPNPFNQETKIGCFVPENSISSAILIFDMNGAQLKSHNIAGKGKQIIIINGKSLKPGMYIYALVVDGKEVDTKRMILTK